MIHSTLRKSLIVTLALAGAVGSEVVAASKHDSIHWHSVIGIEQANNVVGSGTGAIAGGGTPWSVQSGHVDVNIDENSIAFDVRGLVLAGGNSIGTPGPVTQVKGTLVCDTDGSASGGNSVIVDTPLVELDEQGNARFSGRIALPPVCTSEPDIAFLIRVGAGRWIGNGTVLR